MSTAVNLECLVNEIIANNDVVVVEKPEKSSKKKSAKAFTDKETRLLILELFKYPQLYNKQTSGYHDRDKRVIDRQHIALAINQAMAGYTENDERKITDNTQIFN